MHVVYSDAHRRHDPRHFLVRGRQMASPEVPQRADVLLAAAKAGGHAIVAPDDFGPGPRAAVHTRAYLAFLESVHARWRELDGAAEEVVPNVHPNAHMRAYPQGIVGQAGWHMADTACPIGAGTFAAACAAADCAVHAAELVLDGAPAAYALARPPGHHAFADMAGGFCFLNNVAIAARHMAARLGRVAIVDVDVHHGNGTQGIFYDADDVLFVSLHAEPSNFYPFFAGYADEVGEGAGAGCNLNLPLAHGSGDDVFLAALDRGVAAVREHVPGALLVSLGFDAYAGDPLSPLEITTEGFAAAARALAALGLPTVLVQEGGYDRASLGVNLTAFLAAFEGR